MEILKTFTQHPWEFAILVTVFWQDELQEEFELEAQFVKSDVNSKSVIIAELPTELIKLIKFDPITAAQNSLFSLMLQVSTAYLA